MTEKDELEIKKLKLEINNLIRDEQNDDFDRMVRLVTLGGVLLTSIATVIKIFSM